MKNIFLFLSGVYFFCGCTTNYKVFGKYTEHNGPEYFQLNNDSTFTYKYDAFHVQEYSSGKWKMDRNRDIILNSYIINKSKNIKLNVQEFDRSGIDFFNLSIIINGDYHSENYKYEIFANDTLYELNKSSILISTKLEYLTLNNNINIKNPFAKYIRGRLVRLTLNPPITNLYLKIVKSPIIFSSTVLTLNPIITKQYFLKSKETNSLIMNVTFSDSLFNYKVFKNERVKIKKNKIGYFNSDLDKWLFLRKASQ